MKNNKINPAEKFAKNMQIALAKHYSQIISNNVGRTFRAKRLKNCNVK